MARNIEIKARARAPERLRERALALSGEPGVEMLQEDVFFDVNHGRLKLRTVDHRAQLIFYEREDHDGPKLSRYHIVELDDPAPLTMILSRALGQRAIVQKRRTLLMVGQTRIHLDDVEGLGHFMELEVVLDEGQDEREGEAMAKDLMHALGVSQEDLVDCAYVDLITSRP